MDRFLETSKTVYRDPAQSFYFGKWQLRATNKTVMYIASLKPETVGAIAEPYHLDMILYPILYITWTRG